jgi:hypothetical protein
MGGAHEQRDDIKTFESEASVFQRFTVARHHVASHWITPSVQSRTRVGPPNLCAAHRTAETALACTERFQPTGEYLPANGEL